jgi:hypothetical protein
MTPSNAYAGNDPAGHQMVLVCAHPSALLLECVQAPPKRRILLLGAMNEGGVGARNRGRIVRLPPVRLRSAVGTQHAAI